MTRRVWPVRRAGVVTHVARCPGCGAVVGELGLIFSASVRRRLTMVGELADDHAITRPLASSIDLHDRALRDRAAPGAVGLLEDALSGPRSAPPVGEVGALDPNSHERRPGAPPSWRRGARCAHTAPSATSREVVRRDVGRHADRDAGRLPLTSRLGKREGRMVGSCEFLTVVVVGGSRRCPRRCRATISHRQRRHPALGVAHAAAGGVVARRAEVALAVDERRGAGTHVLGEADHGVVDRGVAVGVVLDPSRRRRRASTCMKPTVGASSRRRTSP